MRIPGVSLGIFAILAGCMLLLACANDQTNRRDTVVTAEPELEPPESAAVSAGHDSDHAPIDCPLRAQGVDANSLRPFEEVEEYIAFLDRADRASWQKPDSVVRALDLQGDETIADLGAGSGYFTFRFADALPRGTVRAIDIEPEMVRHIHHKAMTDNRTNVEAVLASVDDPEANREDDIVFVCDILHHVRGRAEWLRKLHEEMRPGARLVLVEFKSGPLPEGPPEAVKLSREQLLDLLTAAGFRLVDDRPDLLPYQQFLVFSS